MANNLITLKFDIDPLGQARPRFSINPQFIKEQSLQARFKGYKAKNVVKGFARDTKQSSNFKKQIGYIAAFQLKRLKQELIECPIEVEINVFKEPPKSTSKIKIKKMLSGEIRPTTKPDVDNYIKGILDGLNKVAWKDDNQIIKVSCSKYFATRGYFTVDILKR